VFISHERKHFVIQFLNVDMRILIDKALNNFYMLQESLISCKHGNILVSLALNENTISIFFTIYILYIGVLSIK